MTPINEAPDRAEDAAAGARRSHCSGDPGNSKTLDVFVAFVERKLAEHGIKKVVPGGDQLEKAFQLFARGERIRQAVEEAIEALDDEEIEVSDDLDRRVP